jgi:hypothetical protein
MRTIMNNGAAFIRTRPSKSKTPGQLYVDIYVGEYPKWAAARRPITLSTMNKNEMDFLRRLISELEEIAAIGR